MALLCLLRFLKNLFLLQLVITLVARIRLLRILEVLIQLRRRRDRHRFHPYWIFPRVNTLISLYHHHHYYYYVGVIDQACGQDGWILAKFFFRVFINRDEVRSGSQSQRETRFILPAHGARHIIILFISASLLLLLLLSLF